MIYPSKIQKTEGDDLEVQEITEGMYSVKNAYKGQYEYFRGRPIVEVLDVSTEHDRLSTESVEAVK